MTEERQRLEQKRQKALERLRANRGKQRAAAETRQQAKADAVKVLLKDYRDAYRQQKVQIQASEESQTVQTPTEPEQLPRLLKASEKVKEKEQKTAEAAERLKEARQRFKQAKQARQAGGEGGRETEEQEPADTPTPTVKRSQLRHDLLSADFFQTASKWLSSMKSGPHLSSTPVEEVEFLYKQAKLRYKALKIMLEDTQRELDGFEAYLRVAKSVEESKETD